MWKEYYKNDCRKILHEAGYRKFIIFKFFFVSFLYHKKNDIENLFEINKDMKKIKKMANQTKGKWEKENRK